MREIHPADDEALTNYVLDHYRRFLTETESTTLGALSIQWKFVNVDSPLMKLKLGELMEKMKSPEVQQWMDRGSDFCRREFRDRLLRDHPNDIILITCPKCQRLARTPRAQMCVHCGYSWHQTGSIHE